VQLFVPLLLKQEKFIYDELVSYVWTHTFVPAVAASRARPASAALAAGVVKRSGQEAALRKWIAALEAVAAQLKQLGREGHIVTLQHQVCRCMSMCATALAGQGSGAAQSLKQLMYLAGGAGEVGAGVCLSKPPSAGS
jgi:hypothetical protein